MKTFIDSNIFIYAAGRRHPLKSSCVRVLDMIAQREFDSLVNTEVIQEIFHVFHNRKRTADGVALSRLIIKLVNEVLPVTSHDIIKAGDLLEKYGTLTVRDAVHTATMLNNKIYRIVTADSHFNRIAEVETITPDSLTG